MTPRRRSASVGQRRAGGLAGLAVALLLALPAAADDKVKLKELEESLAADRAAAETWSSAAKALREELQVLREEMIVVAAKTQELEDELSAVDATLASLRAEESRRMARLSAQHGRLAHTLGALQRIALRPPEALLAQPGLPIDTARSASLLSLAVPEVERRVSVLRSAVEELQELRAQIQAQQEELAIASSALDAERTRLTALVERKRELRDQATEEAEAARDRAARLAVEAKDLRDLLERLERERAEREAREKAAREKAEREARERDRRLAELRAAREALEKAAREKAEQEALARAARQAELKAAEEARQAELRAAEEARRKAAEELRARAERERELKTALELAKREAEAAERAAKAAEEQQARLQTGPTVSDLEKPENVRAFPVSPTVANLTMPARGDVVAKYGQSAAAGGLLSKGITIATRSAAQVVAAYDGRVVYAGEFRGYGQILIIEHGGRYHTLLAGLQRIDAVAGQWVLAGEPVGVMGGAAGSNPELYLELRRTGQPINPLPWLATTSDKVQG